MKKNLLFILLLAIFVLLLIGALHKAKAQISSQLYYQFNSGSLAATVGSNTLTTSNVNYTAVASGGLVGGYITIPLTSGCQFTGASVTPVNGLTMEFLMKAGYDFGRARDMIILTWGNASVKFYYPDIQFITKTGTTAHNFGVSLAGIDRAKWGYYVDAQWHHIVCTYDASTGLKQIYVDGVCPTGFSTAIAPGTIAAASNQALKINASPQYSKYAGSIDEVAVYTAWMRSTQVYNDYVQARDGNHYTVAVSASAPTAPSTTGSLDTLEFPVGYVLGSDSSYAVPTSVIQQLYQYPLPRYKPGHTLRPNLNVVNIKYLSGWQENGVSTAQAVQRSLPIQHELASNWNYYFLTNNYINQRGYRDTVNKFEGAWTVYSNRNRGWKTAAMSFWATPCATCNSYAESQALADNFYVRNSTGQFLNRSGTVITTGKLHSPAMPMTYAAFDAMYYRINVDSLLTNMTDTLDLLMDNGEIMQVAPYTNSLMRKDPYIMGYFDTTDFAPSDTEEFAANWQRRYTVQMRDSAYTELNPNTWWTQYQVDGQDGTNGRNYYHWRYSERRHINKNGTQHYPTFDYYPRYPYGWLSGSPGYRGWTDYIEARNTEISLGDVLNSPFMGFGWNANEERNMRPGRSLGMNNLFGVTGSEFYYPGFFASDQQYGSAFAYSQGYAWQVATPSYAQAVTSRYEHILRHGYLLPGDMPDDYVNLTGNGYQYWAGDVRKIVCVRKDSAALKYIIAGTIQPHSSMKDNAPRTDTCTIVLAGTPLTFDVRQQGSVYYYDSSGTFYQLNKEHQWEHPQRWTDNFAFEAEVYDSSRVTPPILTYKTTNGVYTEGNYRTVISYADTATIFDTLRYYFQPRQDTTYTVWILARSRSISQTSSIKYTYCPNQCGVMRTFTIPADTNWQWIRTISGSHERIRNLDSTWTQLKILFGNKYGELDRIVFSVDSTETFTPEYIPPGSSSFIVNIIPSGSLNFCTTSSITLTASAPLQRSYLWSTGATTKSITSRVAATYTCTVTNISGATGTASVTTAPVFCPGTCLAPTSLTQGTTTTTSAYISFPKPSNAKGYVVYIRDSATTRTVFQTFNVSTANVKVRNLLRNKPYYVKVRTICNGGYSEYTTDSLKIRTSP